MNQKSAKEMNVVVVGAGIVGSAIAYGLACRGAQVTVLDSGHPGHGASSHSFAWINAGAKSPSTYHDFNRRSLEMWDRFALHLGLHVGLAWGGKVSWESSESGAQELKTRVAQLQQWGYPTRLIDEQDLQQLVPGLSLGPVKAAEFSEIEGQVEPQLVVNACLRRVRSLGGRVERDTEVTGFLRDGNSKRVSGVATNSGELSCDVVVLATGVAMTELAARVDVSIPQEESPGVVIRTDPQPPLLTSVPVVYAPALAPDQWEIHMRQCHDGTFMIGEGSQESLRRDDSQAHADELLKRATHYLPALADASAIPVPVGYRPMPLDGYPVLGFPAAAPNVYVALTHSGVTLAPIISESAAIEILDGVRIDGLAPYRPERFL